MFDIPKFFQNVRNSEIFSKCSIFRNFFNKFDIPKFFQNVRYSEILSKCSIFRNSFKMFDIPNTILEVFFLT